MDGFKNFPRIIIGGDFNEMNDLQFLIDIGFKNLVKLPTTKWLTRIDHLYVNFENDVLTWVNPSYFSDHHSIVTVLGKNDAAFSHNIQPQLDENMDFTEYIDECSMVSDDSEQVEKSLTKTLFIKKML